MSKVFRFEDADVRLVFVEFQDSGLLGFVLPASVHVVEEAEVPASCVVFVAVVCLDVEGFLAVLGHDLSLVYHEGVLVYVADPLDCSVDFVRCALACESPVALGLPVLELRVEVLQELHARCGRNVQGRQYEVQAFLFLPESCLESCFALFLDLRQRLESVAGVLGGADCLVALRAESHLAVSALLAGVLCVRCVCHVIPSLNRYVCILTL